MNINESTKKEVNMNHRGLKKTGKFRKMYIEIEKRGHGDYIVTGDYKGTRHTLYTNNSEMWDWIDDDSNKKKQTDVLRQAYNMIKRAYDMDKELNTMKKI